MSCISYRLVRASIILFLGNLILLGCRPKSLENTDASNRSIIASNSLPGVFIHGVIRYDNPTTPSKDCKIPLNPNALRERDLSAKNQVASCHKQEIFEWDGTSSNTTNEAVKEINSILKDITKNNGKILWKYREEASQQFIGLIFKGEYHVLIHSNVGLHSFLQIITPNKNPTN